jgi:hypothetical protein
MFSRAKIAHFFLHLRAPFAMWLDLDLKVCGIKYQALPEIQTNNTSTSKYCAEVKKSQLIGELAVS